MGRAALGASALVVGYAILFSLAHPLIGATATVLAIVPPTLGAAAFGLRWGLAITVVTLLGTAGLWRSFGDEPGTVIVRVGSGIGAVIVIALAAALGRLRDLQVQMERGILQRDRLLDDLRRSKDRLQAFVGELEVALLVVGIDGRIWHAEGAGLERLRPSALGLSGRSIFEICATAADRSTVRLALMGVSGIADVLVGERHVRFSFVPTKGGDGGPTGAVGIGLLDR